MSPNAADLGSVAGEAGAASTWNRLAGLYRFQERLERPAIDRALALAAPQAGELAVDVGAGTGLVARRLAHRPGGGSTSNRRRRASPGRSACSSARNPALPARGMRSSPTTEPNPRLRGVAVDPSAGMLAAGGRPPPGWVRVRADGAALPVTKGAADVVVIAYLLHLLDADERARVLAEVVRALAPSGRVVTVTPGTRPGALGTTVGTAMDTAARLAPAWLGGLARHDPSSELARAGLTVTGIARVGGVGYPSLVVRAERRGAE